MSFHPALPSTWCELQWTAWYCSRVTPSLMWPDCQLRAFNAEVTGSFTIAFSPCFHSCPPTLVPSFGDVREGCSGWRIALSSQDTSLPRTWRSSAISPSSFRSSLVILGPFPPRLGLWAYYSKWVGAPRSFGPTIAPQNPAIRNLGRGGGFWCSRADNMVDWALPSYGRQSFFGHPWHVPSASTYEAHRH